MLWLNGQCLTNVALAMVPAVVGAVRHEGERWNQTLCTLIQPRPAATCGLTRDQWAKGFCRFNVMTITVWPKANHETVVQGSHYASHRCRARWLHRFTDRADPADRTASARAATDPLCA